MLNRLLMRVTIPEMRESTSGPVAVCIRISPETASLLAKVGVASSSQLRDGFATKDLLRKLRFRTRVSHTMSTSLPRQVSGPLLKIEPPAELTPSVRQLLALASFQQEILDLGADVGAIARRAAERARALSWADGAMVEIIKSDGAVHRGVVGTGAASRSRRAVSVVEGPWYALVGTTPQICDDTEDDPRVDPEVCRRLRTRSVITVPLHRHDVRLGAITVTSSRPHAFDNAQAAVLQLLGGLVSSAAIGSQLITELRLIGRRREGAPVSSEKGFRRLFFENPQAMWVLDAQTQAFLAVNDAAVARYGYSADEFAGLTIAAVRHDPAHLVVDLARARTGRTAYSARHHLMDGRVIDVDVTTAALDFAGRPAVLSLIHDVTERNRLDRQLRQGAFRDPLTGGANRVLFAERVSHALIRICRRNATIAILVIDLDHFKTVNDSMGYASGDSLLQAAAARIQEALRPGDTVARLGSDEFAVLPRGGRRRPRFLRYRGAPPRGVPFPPRVRGWEPGDQPEHRCHHGVESQYGCW